MWHPPVKCLWLVQSIMAMASMYAFITPWIILCYKWLRCTFFVFVVQWRLALLWKCWALSIFIELFEALWCMWVFTEWLLNWNEEVYNMGNKLLKCNLFGVIISWSKNFPEKHVHTLWHLSRSHTFRIVIFLCFCKNKNPIKYYRYCKETKWILSVMIFEFFIILV